MWDFDSIFRPQALTVKVAIAGGAESVAVIPRVGNGYSGVVSVPGVNDVSVLTVTDAGAWSYADSSISVDTAGVSMFPNPAGASVVFPFVDGNLLVCNVQGAVGSYIPLQASVNEFAAGFYVAIALMGTVTLARFFARKLLGFYR